MGIHRVRLSDREIEIIREALRQYTRETDDGEVWEVARRFLRWGHVDEYWGGKLKYGPFYARPRRVRKRRGQRLGNVTT